jgi:hypothetical protein
LAIALAAALVPVALHSQHGAHRVGMALLVSACTAAALVLFGLALGAARLSRSAIVAYLAGVAVRIAYLFVTPYSIRTHDVDQHIEYVEYLLAHHALPPSTALWASYHPPFYFVLAALLWRALTLAGVTARWVLLLALQLQSLAYHLGFLAFALLTGERWIGPSAETRSGDGPAVSGRQRALFAALLCLWPSGVMHSVRLGNDDLFYLFFGAGLFFAARWWQGARDRDLHMAFAGAALATLSKSNGLILFMVLGALLGLRIFQDPDRSVRRHARRIGPGALMFLGVTGVTLGRAALDTLSGKRSNFLVGNTDRLTKALAVGNSAANYLWFDVKMFVTHPYASSWVDDTGRQYFWNFALKSALVGSFEFDGVALSNLAELMAFSLLALLGVTAIGLARDKREWEPEAPLWSTIALGMASLAALRMSVPMACSNDFRYVWPIMVPALCLYVRSIARLGNTGRTGWAWFGEAVGWGFFLESVGFFAVLSMQWAASR